MAEIHPNDIGLATFADVGDVEKLKTSAKNLVDALNEIYQNGTSDGASSFSGCSGSADACSIALANGAAIKTPGLAFKVLSDGSVHADKEYTSPCADYAEYFEWADGNPNNEDRTGYFVKLKDG